MALLHNALTRGPWTVAVKGALGDTRSEGGVERYGETLQPNIDIWTRPEWAWLRQEQLWAVSQQASAVVGEASMCAISNPVNSDNLVIVTAVSGNVGTLASQLRLGLATRTQIAATLGLQGNAVTRDTRWSKSPTVAVSLVPVERWNGSDATAPFDTVLDEVGMDTAGSIVLFTGGPWVLEPGAALWTQGNALNSAVRTSFSGYVRKGFKGELEDRGFA